MLKSFANGGLSTWFLTLTPWLFHRVRSVVPRQQHLLDQDLSFYSGCISAALASVLMHELASLMLTQKAAKRAIETWEKRRFGIGWDKFMGKLMGKWDNWRLGIGQREK